MFDSVVKIRLINKKTMNISVSEKWLSRKFYFWRINLTTFLEISESFSNDGRRVCVSVLSVATSAGAYSGPSLASKMECSAVNYFRKTLRLRYLTMFLIRLCSPHLNINKLKRFHTITKF